MEVASSERDEMTKERAGDSSKLSEHGHDLEALASPVSVSGADGLQRTMTAQDWSGPDDPENPHNWPFWQRVYHTYVLSESESLFSQYPRS